MMNEKLAARVSAIAKLIGSARLVPVEKDGALVNPTLPEEAAAEHNALRARIRTLEGLVRKLEWSGGWDGYDKDWRVCPLCGGLEPSKTGFSFEGHKPDCELKAALDGGAE